MARDERLEMDLIDVTERDLRSLTADGGGETDHLTRCLTRLVDEVLTTGRALSGFQAVL